MRNVCPVLRDEGVAGSNPATPTKYPLAALNPTNFETSCTKLYADARCGWLDLAAARKRLLRITEGGDSLDNYVSDPASSDPNRRQRARIHVPAATSSASLLRA